MHPHHQRHYSSFNSKTQYPFNSNGSQSQFSQIDYIANRQVPRYSHHAEGLHQLQNQNTRYVSRNNYMPSRVFSSKDGNYGLGQKSLSYTQNMTNIVKTSNKTQMRRKDIGIEIQENTDHRRIQQPPNTYDQYKHVDIAQDFEEFEEEKRLSSISPQHNDHLFSPDSALERQMLFKKNFQRSPSELIGEQEAQQSKKQAAPQATRKKELKNQNSKNNQSLFSENLRMGESIQNSNGDQMNQTNQSNNPEPVVPNDLPQYPQEPRLQNSNSDPTQSQHQVKASDREQPRALPSYSRNQIVSQSLSLQQQMNNPLQNSVETQTSQRSPQQSQPSQNPSRPSPSRQQSHSLIFNDSPRQPIQMEEVDEGTIQLRYNLVVQGVRDPIEYSAEVEYDIFKDFYEQVGQDLKKTIEYFIQKDCDGICPEEEYRVVHVKRIKNERWVEVKQQEPIGIIFQTSMIFMIYFRLKPQQVQPAPPQQNQIEPIPSQTQNQSQLNSLLLNQSNSASNNGAMSPDFTRMTETSLILESFFSQVKKDMQEQEKRLTNKLESVQKQFSVLEGSNISFQQAESNKAKSISKSRRQSQFQQSRSKFQTTEVDQPTGNIMARDSMIQSVQESQHFQDSKSSHSQLNQSNVSFQQSMQIQNRVGSILHPIGEQPGSQEQFSHDPQIVDFKSLSTLGQAVHMKPSTDGLDLVFLYSQPIVQMRRFSNQLEPCDAPLDLDKEYLEVVKSLQRTGKQFTIMREAINCSSIAQMIEKKPKIIHISSHGAFDEKSKEFFLAIEKEKDETGQEHRIKQSKLKTLIKPPKHYSAINSIKMAFISACHSQEIGDIFLKSGIPVVVSVNSDQEIKDEVCREFSAKFYNNLLEGNTIQESFNKAQNLVDVLPKGFHTCCCAHKHTDDCEWYKLYQNYPKKAHEMHAKKNCGCPNGDNGKHRQQCENYQNFKTGLDKLNETKRKQEQKLKNKQNHAATLDAQKMQELLGNMSSEDEAMLIDPFLQNSEPQILSSKDQANIESTMPMCCCKPDLAHNESLKFDLKVSDDISEEKKKQLLHTPIFNKPSGEVHDLDKFRKSLMKMTQVFDNQMIYGRDMEIYQAIQFLVRQKNKRILTITGNKGSRCDLIAKSAIKYVVNRHFFRDGSLFIDASNSLNIDTLCQRIKSRMPLCSTDTEGIQDQMKDMDLILLLKIDRELSDDEVAVIQESMYKLTQNTDLLKIVLVYEQDTQANFKQSKNEKFVSQMSHILIEPLNQKVAAKMMYQLNKNIKGFKDQYKNDQELSGHKIFKNISLMPEHILKVSEVMIDESRSLDEAYQQQIQDLQRDQSPEAKINNYESNKNLINRIFFDKIVSVYPDEVNILYTLCYAQHGLTNFDLIRLILLPGSNKYQEVSGFPFSFALDFLHF